MNTQTIKKNRISKASSENEFTKLFSHNQESTIKDFISYIEKMRQERVTKIELKVESKTEDGDAFRF
jgi:hypothetical protein